MELARQLHDRLAAYQKSHPALFDWRMDLRQTRGINIGIKENQLGGPYSAPGYKRSISGELFLIWKDQRFTAAKLDSRVVADFMEYISLWETTAYHDPDGVGLFPAEAVPEVELKDPKARTIADDEFTAPFQLLQNGLERLTGDGLAPIDAAVRCYADERHLLNSRGFSLEYLQTPVDFYFSVLHSYGESYQEKKWADEAEIQRILDSISLIGKQLRTEAAGACNGPVTLLFPPDLFETFLEHYLMANLYGSIVANRQSRFSLEDFRQKRRVLRDDLSLELDTLQSMRYFSYPCTSEGVPGGKIELIKDGALMTPVLNWKYACKVGMKPTPLPAGGGFFLRSAVKEPSWDEVLATIDRGLIVYSVLGLHTQDASAGKFSLTADQCLWIEGGKIRGKKKAVINGDFLASLQADSSRLALVDGKDNPGFVFQATASE